MFSWQLIKKNLTENLEIMKAIKNSTFLIKKNDKNETRSNSSEILSMSKSLEKS